MKPSAPDVCTRKTLMQMFVQLVIFWGLYFGLWPLIVVSLENFWSHRAWNFFAFHWVATGMALFIGGVGLAIWSAVALAGQGKGLPLLSSQRPAHLVVSGPYRSVRNPMAIAGVAQGIAVGLMLGSPSVIAVNLLSGLIWQMQVRPKEENFLEQQFGEEFRLYRENVSNWLPRLTPWSGKENG